MSFKADQQAIRSFGGQIDSLTDDADAAISYVRNHLGIGYDKGRMFFTVVESATTVRDALMANYSQLSKLATESAQEIVKAANHYRDTDATAAARIDATY
jgi:hypothetical protein